MSIIYQIDFTDPGVTSFTINPAAVNGPGFPNANTSLTLHGTGRLDWGQAVNSNFVKILETSASPQRAMPVNLAIVSNTAGLSGQVVVNGDVSGTFNPDGFKFDIVGASLIDGAYTVQTSTYNGINDETTIIINESFASVDNSGTIQYTIVEPDPIFIRKPYILGQMWFNKTDTKTYVYKITQTTPVEVRQWTLAADGSVAFAPETDPPLLPLAGTLWYNETTRQLLVWNPNLGASGEWEASGDVAFGPTIPNTVASDGQLWYDTTINQLKIHDTVTGGFTSIAERYVLKSGDTMFSTASGGSPLAVEGVLNFSTPQITDYISIGKSRGKPLTSGTPDIRFFDSAYLAAGDDMHLVFGGRGSSPTQRFQFEISALLGDSNDEYLLSGPRSRIFTIVHDNSNTDDEGVWIDYNDSNNGNDYAFKVHNKTLIDRSQVVPNTRYVDRKSIPIGMVVAFGGILSENFWSSFDGDWLLCNGADYDPNDYPLLSIFLGTRYGTGPGSNFRVPDYDNQYLFGTIATVDVGTPFNILQSLHSHEAVRGLTFSSIATGTGPGVNVATGATSSQSSPPTPGTFIGTLGTNNTPGGLQVQYYIRARD